MPSKKKSPLETLEIKKPKKKKILKKIRGKDCTCNAKQMALNKRIHEINRKLSKCSCIDSEDVPCKCTATPVSDYHRRMEKRDVYLLPYYGVPIRKNKKYLLECTSYETTPASCARDTAGYSKHLTCSHPHPPHPSNKKIIIDKTCRVRPDPYRPHIGKSNFVGHCISFDSLESLRPSKRHSCHCCCSRKATNKPIRYVSSPTGRTASHLDVIDEEDLDIIEELPKHHAKKKARDPTTKTTDIPPKSKTSRRYDGSPSAIINTYKSTAKNKNYGNAYSYAYDSCYGNAFPHAAPSATGNANVKAKVVETKVQKSLEDSCADFLNIVTDNILETVQTSVSMTLQDYCTKTTEKIDRACQKLEQNDLYLRSLYDNLIESTSTIRSLIKLLYGLIFAFPLLFQS